MLAAAAALATAAAALITVALVASQDDPTPPTTSATRSTHAAPAPSSPATGLRLTDNGDNVVLTWSYPPGAAAPVIISAAEAGQPMRAMQSLPAGTQTYTMPGLDPTRDYCLTVTLAYTADHTVMAAPVCTTRHT